MVPKPQTLVEPTEGAPMPFRSDSISRPTRLRSLLFAPAVRPDFVEKLASRGADGVVIDCEDATPPNAKGEGRRNARSLAPKIAGAGDAGLRPRQRRGFRLVSR